MSICRVNLFDMIGGVRLKICREGENQYALVPAEKKTLQDAVTAYIEQRLRNCGRDAKVVLVCNSMPELSTKEIEILAKDAIRQLYDVKSVDSCYRMIP